MTHESLNTKSILQKISQQPHNSKNPLTFEIPSAIIKICEIQRLKKKKLAKNRISIKIKMLG